MTQFQSICFGMAIANRNDVSRLPVEAQASQGGQEVGGTGQGKERVWAGRGKVGTGEGESGSGSRKLWRKPESYPHSFTSSLPFTLLSSVPAVLSRPIWAKEPFPIVKEEKYPSLEVNLHDPPQNTVHATLV